MRCGLESVPSARLPPRRRRQAPLLQGLGRRAAMTAPVKAAWRRVEPSAEPARIGGAYGDRCGVWASRPRLRGHRSVAELACDAPRGSRLAAGQGTSPGRCTRRIEERARSPSRAEARSARTRGFARGTPRRFGLAAEASPWGGHSRLDGPATQHQGLLSAHRGLLGPSLPARHPHRKTASSPRHRACGRGKSGLASTPE